MKTSSDATIQEIDEVMQAASNAAIAFRNVSIVERAAFMHAIANGIENSGG